MVDVQSTVRAGVSTNEDLVWTGDNAAIVLDGATGLGDRQVSDAESDAQWYVNALCEALRDRIESDEELSAVAASAVERVADEYAELSGPAAAEKHEVPSGAGAVCRWDDGSLEYLVLGDCSVVVDRDDGVDPVLGEGPRELDARVVDEMVAIRERADGYVSYSDLREHVKSLLVEHRKQMNEPGGYWTFGFDPEAVDHAETGYVPRDELEFVLSFTDGFEPIYDPYDVFAEWTDLVSYVRSNGIERAIRVLRAFEEADPECERYPRLKPSDDVGVATVDFTR
ncbi:protein phosphatase 2C domain-containing protein [Salinigranum salinum]|uniref:protein phosphatase 2C domain-containing protein n=1 Tax=Salinigranum salinum TaxID=1364937 RepID=UPI0012603FBC|nr:protein phosphatase 2C domain-containing protein [Salinigranum salinum]